MIFVWPLAKIIIVIESISVSVFLIGTFSFCMNVLIHFDCFLCLWPPSHPACKELFDLIYLKPKALLLSYYFLSGDPECFCRCRVSAGDCPLSESMMTRAPVDALFLTPVQGRPSSLGLPAFCPLTEPRRPSPQCLSELYIIVSFSWASCFLPPLHVCTSFRFCLFQLTFPFFLFLSLCGTADCIFGFDMPCLCVLLHLDTLVLPPCQLQVLWWVGPYLVCFSMIPDVTLVTRAVMWWANFLGEGSDLQLGSSPLVILSSKWSRLKGIYKWYWYNINSVLQNNPYAE